MKIVHINTTDWGGAANAAVRLHLGLLNEGVDSHFLCLNRRNKVKNGHLFFSWKNLRPIRLLSKMGIIPTQLGKNHRMIPNKNNEYDFFSFPHTDFDVLSHPIIQQADIINLHWVANFLDYPSFFENVDKPVVWTMHDMNAFRGITHYVNDPVTKYPDYELIEQRMRRIKKNAFDKAKNLNIVTPSEWLKKESSKSTSLQRFNHYRIPYSLDIDIYRPYNQVKARAKFNIPPDKTALLFVSEHVANKRKGMDILLEAVKMIEKIDDKVVLCAVGSTSSELGNLENLCSIGAVNKDEDMALLYSLADAFVLPSREDNLPNTMLEAMACGTPVISFQVGGAVDVINSGFNGILAKELSVAALKEAIVQFLDNPEKFDRKQIREFAVANFALEVQAKKYIQLYRSILNR